MTNRASSTRRRLRSVGLMIASGLAILGAPQPAVGAQGVLRGRVLDEQSSPIVGARVDLASGTPRTLRTDFEGRFVLAEMGPNPFRLTVRQVGFQPVDTTLASLANEEVTIRMRRAVTRLSNVVVRGNWQGIHGSVADSQSLEPLPQAVIRVLGVSAKTRTDSLGAFAVDLERAGTYVVRVERAGYASKVYTVNLGKAVARELLITLAESNADDARTQNLWREFDSRTRMRGLNSALVTADELSAIGTETTSEALQRAKSFALKNLRLHRDVCLYVNGEPKPGWTLDAFDVSEILAIEVYGRRGELTNNLGVRWPKGVPCGPATGTSPVRLSESERRLQVQSVVIWLKKQ